MRRLLLAAVFSSIVAGSVASEEKTRILLIGKEPDHPHGSHMYMHVSGVLAACLAQTEGVETVVSNGWPKAEADKENVKAIVVYTSPAAELLFDGEHRDEVKRVLDGGAGLVTIHWASSVNKANLERLGPVWMSYLGGTWVSNVGLSGGKSILKQLEPEHPVHRGWEQYEITDEYYLNPTIGEGAVPLLQVTEKQGSEVIVGWAYERPGGGRAFATTLGHPYANFQREDFRKMLVNAILWTAHREVAESGSPVALTEEQLALPPK